MIERTLTPTDEQLVALDLFRTGESIAIEAGAGTGKTSTLLLLAEDAPNRRGQYVAFNKAITVEAQGKFPSHVATSTAHSLAFRAVGVRYKHRLNGQRMRAKDVGARLGLNQRTYTDEHGSPIPLTVSTVANCVMRMVAKYCQSADIEPGPQHHEWVERLDADQNRDLARDLVPHARRMWADLSRVDGIYPYRHEHYLKAWQLSDPVINADFICFDEAQDANAVLLSIVEQQKHCQLVFCGDSNQAIYGWNGAVDALAKVPVGRRAVLSRSFRFGPEIAEQANIVLERLDADLRLTGAGAPGRVGTIARPTARLSRTNGSAVGEMIGLMEAGRKPHLIGGGADVVSFCRAAEDLQSGRPTSHPDLCLFPSWGEVLAYVEEDAGAADLKLMVNLIQQHGADKIRRALEAQVSEERADLILSTAHRAKGREWDSVQLAGDFPSAGDKGDTPAERRLIYVALTRARKELDLDAVLIAPRPVTEGTSDGAAPQQKELVV